MRTVKIGGVPEHFNLAWYLALKNREFKDVGINLRWKDFYGGTGAMNKALREGEIDMAVILTEGVIKDIIDGNPTKIVQTFVKSPLIWGIHVAHQSNYHTIDDLKGKKAAISRYGSGSHLMSYVNAEQHDWELDEDLNFEVIRNLDGAVEGLTNGKADYFLWEKFTTKPIVDKGVFRRIGNIPTPWPCFVIAVREDYIADHLDDLKMILEIINNITIEFKQIPSIDRTIANRYEQKLEDVQEWLSLTEWSQHIMDEETVDTIQDTLYSLDIIPRKVNYDELVKKID
ncbi:substrate-binding domain-containing protein [Psychroserpens sp.]|uniref:substrate-binding domain-containing protein n=1 Tax=Psychroserpens sp. TaxID=2020870 RepID=UPI001B00487D|nr:substrate-binding domain-containing protein [Psychroserpens sp.]MBO6606515.1 ABC transporter substrate-binding protein [Psychroserpens sp.]MBO6653219.1 ABC transporter substrate-binding protein [Psychroserpens sp.]MBO6680753.1 ABC transporter substrate-binding protein [Psychroserpens sp.]MBO6750289.1 ABC transporter substrate-binding protein [Psychroserpens sp.]MBO6914770.1 ABC transporter substrate-binding protein [Psychroserpens sp.]